jgi:hypothetical protein
VNADFHAQNVPMGNPLFSMIHLGYLAHMHWTRLSERTFGAKLLRELKKSTVPPSTKGENSKGEPNSKLKAAAASSYPVADSYRLLDSTPINTQIRMDEVRTAIGFHADETLPTRGVIVSTFSSERMSGKHMVPHGVVPVIYCEILGYPLDQVDPDPATHRAGDNKTYDMAAVSVREA